MQRRGGGAGNSTGPGRLRPAAAFVLIGCVLALVSWRATHLALDAPGEEPDPRVERQAPWPRFEISDRSGTTLAVSVECFDLTASPRSLWRSHTPDHIAGVLAGQLRDESASSLLTRLLPAPPPGEEPGLVRVAFPRLLRFDQARAAAVDAWLTQGGLDGEGRGPIDGIWLHPLDGGGYTLEWAPALALSEAARLRHLGERARHRPDLWTGRLLADLRTLVHPDPTSPLPPEIAAELAGLPRAERRAALADAIWAELLPTTFRVVRRKIDPVTAHGLHEAFEREAISPWQMQLVARLDRHHPTRPEAFTPLRVTHGDQSEPPHIDSDAFSILGHWGVLGEGDALERARDERDHAPEELEWGGLPDPVARRAWELETRWRPWSGLELLCSNELEKPRWKGLLQAKPRTYTARIRTLARDRRGRWENRRVPDYFIAADDGAEVPRCEVTLDAELQESLHGELQGLLEEFRAAVAEGIVVDVASGDVLAVDGVYAYDVAGFAPIRHVFTPGSTMKAVVMSIALDQGLVTPQERFETFAPDGIVLREGRHRRHIREALGAPKEATVSATEGLAYSVNAVLVQIGLRIPAPILRAKLSSLGYGQRPGVGLGPEAAGHLPPLNRDGTWSRLYAHASVSFGHELGVTLWQHAQALATIARGGIFRPLRLLRAVEQGERRYEILPVEGRRVLSEGACRSVRSMMAVGAREGTGARVASPELCPEFDYIGTKTGTTEKVPTEVSLHVEWPRQLELEAQGKPWSSAEHRALIGKRANLGIRNTCYTSSMCAIGRIGERELMTLIVVDEPRSRHKFGADVAGRAAVRMLRRAHGLAPDYKGEGDPAQPSLATEVATRAAAAGEAAFNHQELPWAGGQGR